MVRKELVGNQKILPNNKLVFISVEKITIQILIVIKKYMKVISKDLRKV